MARLSRLSSLGALDTSYGALGYLTLSYGTAAMPMSLAADGAGGAWVTVLHYPVAGPPMHSGALHIDATGTPDPGFGTGGYVDFGPTEYFLFAEPSVGIDGAVVVPASDYTLPGPTSDIRIARFSSATINDFAGSWAATGAFGICLHTVGGGITQDWTLAGSGNCVSGTTANWRAVPSTASVAAHFVAPGTGATAFRFGLRPSSNQAPGNYTAPISFSVVAPAV